MQGKFEEAKERVAKHQKQKGDFKKEDEQEDKKTRSDSVDLLAKLKPKPGSWSCEVCLVTNPPEVLNATYN